MCKANKRAHKLELKMLRNINLNLKENKKRFAFLQQAQNQSILMSSLSVATKRTYASSASIQKHPYHLVDPSP